ncbi:hypothetical protein PHYBLDRAFT_151789 [Phycomyces blakesleeanus NRRL 1555(-)]|uniref:Arrestin C-terminal-like domain-containing protein n=1 Tax=Phycomyces blakesleeanus (strain ATCC 8743b / DSM 1359 / FGSC 10004 / NBRC 33097 / NRRL 1555) TaxID=763407 RepID=A0A167K352_PHYB8|nr:hypothetical protein PHYBLDRAFT_151789 [Phycomyces blakesleeanus NRRL 1555(-)]OAD67179.1 hypothetical protein PHYBLDRAFT_151789 [Phycomyces blakesleeanus NRRL 1555(-)]|eukprot:XP_018285219.1 hypothetical protein PHYBLDRAFT_151789 [Phycomyces blakesleeanus NRRL 1555(-)]
MVAIFGKSQLEIQVTTDEILLQGQADESAGKLLQGTLVLNLAEQTKIRSIVLEFIGKMRVSWSEGPAHNQRHYKQERTIISHLWDFLPESSEGIKKKARSFGPGRYEWNFELTVPGDLPQSVSATSGQVDYLLKATVQRSGLVHNIVKKMPIRIFRCLLSCAFELIQSFEIHNTWADKVEYDISLPSKVYTHGENIPVTFNILPIAPHLSVISLMATLKECCTYTTKDHTKTDARILRFSRHENPFLDTTFSDLPYWNRVVNLKVPNTSPSVLCDASNDMILIEHKISIIISIANPDGYLSEVRCSVPVTIIDSYAEQQYRLDELPAYNDIWRSVPYSLDVLEALRSRSQSLSSTTSDSSVQSIRSPAISSGLNEGVAVTGSRFLISQNSSHDSIIIREGEERGDEDAIKRAQNQTREQSMPLSYSDRPSGWWDDQALSRVPSYRTALRNDFVYEASNLPTYDSIQRSQAIYS